MKREANSQPRWVYIDVLKGLCMMAIIMEHSAFTPSSLWYVCHNFSSRTFFFISGLFFLSRYKPFSFRQKLLNICTTLLVPYLLYWFLSYALSEMARGNFCFFSGWLNELSLGLKLWFMPALIVSEVVAACYFALPWCSQKRWAIHVLPFLFLVVHACLPEMEYPWCFKWAMLAGVFLSAGIVCRLYFDKLYVWLQKRSALAVLMVMVVVFTLVDGWWSGRSMFFNVSIREYATFFPMSAAYIGLVLALSIRWKHFNRLPLFVGKYSLLYYFFQTQVLRLVCSVAVKFVVPPSFAMAILTALVATVLLSPVVYVVQRYFPLLAGKLKYTLPT